MAIPRRTGDIRSRVPITNPTTLMFPAAHVTKHQIVDYYAAVAPYILPHLKNRPVTLKRYPDGIRGPVFYEKDAPSFTPRWVQTSPVWRRSGESQIHYIVINDADTLVWCAQIASIELHPFLHRIDNVQQPTSVVFDLDPGEGAGLVECAGVALRLRGICESAGLTSLVKVSGSKGLQVYVPLNTPTTYGDTQSFARGIAEHLAREHPDRIVSEMARSRRTGKVFIDWSQNADYKTTVGVYSMRAKRERPYVSMPVRWEEIERVSRTADVASLSWAPGEALARLAKVGDLFQPLLTLRQRLRSTGPRPALVRGTAHAATTTSRTPRRSRQGGRRRYLLQKARGRSILRIEFGDTFSSWSFAGDLAAGHADATLLSAEYTATRFETDVRKAIDAGNIEVIEGSVASGSLRLFFSGGSAIAGAWRFTRTARTRQWALTSEEPRARGARSEASAPQFVAPMSATPVDTLPDGDEWLYELKLDGYRAIAIKDGSRVRLFSRKAKDLTGDFPAVVDAIGRLAAHSLVLDGEIVALDAEGRPSFQRLQHRTGQPPIVYYAFDLLHHDGATLARLPLEERKRQLEMILGDSGVRFSGALPGSAATVEAAVARLGLEGVIAKRRASRYEPGKRSAAWLKRKLIARQEFVIGGYKPGLGSFESLIVGYYQDGRLWFAGKVRNGYTPALRAKLWKMIRPLETLTYPFADTPVRTRSHWGEGLTTEDMTTLRWLEPTIVAEIGFVEWTPEGRLRHSTFIGLRPDKEAREVVRE
jgi:bifunctional non-homologous end joining protein LigD